jgi:hypothetical protein
MKAMLPKTRLAASREVGSVPVSSNGDSPTAHA